MSNYYDVKQFIVPDSLKTSMNSVLNKKLGTTSVNYDPKVWAANVGAMVPLPVKTATGSIAHFEDGADDVPLKSLTAQIVPIQEGTGDPSPSNPRPISGTSVLNVEQRGKNLLGLERTSIITSAPSLVRRDFTEKQVYVGITATNAFNNSITNSYSIGEDSVTVNTARSGYGLGFPIKVKPSTTYYFNQITSYQMGIGYFDFNGNFISDTSLVSVGSFTTPSNCYWLLLVFRPTPNTEATYQKPSLNLGTTATTYEPYTATTYPIALGQTVYGGSADVVEGMGEVTRGYGKITDLATNYYYSTANKRWEVSGIPNIKVFGSRSIDGFLSDIWKPDVSAYIGDEGTFFSVNGVVYFYTSNSDSLEGNIAYPLATPTDFTFTGQEINSLEGVNNIWHDGNGTTEVEYRADLILGG